MDLDFVRLFPYELFVGFTECFSKGNYISDFQFGKIYHGKSVRIAEVDYFVVKIWEIPDISGDNGRRLMDEIILLRHEKLICRAGMVKLYGFCNDGKHLAAIYNFKALDSVLNLIPKDSFNWLQRIKAAVNLANLLRFFHSPGNSMGNPFIVRNLDAAHILLDETFLPRLCDFGTATGGILSDRIVCKEVRGTATGARIAQ